MNESSTNRVQDEAPMPPQPVQDEPTAATKEELKVLETADQSTSAELDQPASSFTASAQAFTDKALHFLSHASNETLGACFLGLGASTYVVLGRLGLVCIGVAGGVVLHATWEGIRGDDRDEATRNSERDKQKETGIEVTRRILAWRGDTSSEQSQQEDLRLHSQQDLDFSRFDPETEKALNHFTDSVVKDYVHYWYDPVLPGEETFPVQCKRTLTAFMLSLSNHLQRKRPADAFLDFMTNASSIIIVFLNELSAALNASPNVSAEEAVAAYLQMKPDSNLAHILDEKNQTFKLSTVAEDILQSYLDPKAYNCPPVHAFLKQVLAQMVLGYSITMCSEPDWINEWIVYGLEESETSSKVMNIVDAGVEGREQEPPKTPGASDAEKVGSTRQDDPSERPKLEHKRGISRAEDAMEEAMQEARRLTEMMMEEDRRREQEEREKQAAVSSSEDVSAPTTHGAPTPTSSQSDGERQEQEAAAWGKENTDTTPSTPSVEKQPFTSFDQLANAQQPTAFMDSPDKKRLEPPQLTLHDASISIFDDSEPNDRAALRKKPEGDYLIQIEPASKQFTGWMIARKYIDFEALHEVLRRISVITGTNFTSAHSELPKWKIHTKASLRTELERYLTDAVRFQPLAESEGMKRFLEKDLHLTKSSGDKGKGLSWPTPDAFGQFGGDMINVLSKAPKGVAGGGKAIFGGVAGVLGGGKKGNQSQASLSKSNINAAESSATHKSRPSSGQPLASDNSRPSMDRSRLSQDSTRSVQRPGLDRKASLATTANGEPKPRPSESSQRVSLEQSRPPSVAGTQTPPTSAPQTTTSPTAKSVADGFDLPPPPSDIPDDYGTSAHRRGQASRASTNVDSRISLEQQQASNSPAQSSQPQQPPQSTQTPATTTTTPTSPAKTAPLTERETSVLIELTFALITALYTLSSAWQFRHTLLKTAKTYLLRPQNPQLLSIQSLIQKSLLEAQTSDAGIAGLIYKLRASALPTEEELKTWEREHPPKSAEEREKLRVKARRLLVERGMPVAVSGVMGAAASGEALGRVFDCLQVRAVARGVVFGLALQGVRVLGH
ncbi:hypothetical protein MBLNU230_g5852t1 [Neophaeotheca triangularis]